MPDQPSEQRAGRRQSQSQPAADSPAESTADSPADRPAGRTPQARSRARLAAALLYLEAVAMIVFAVWVVVASLGKSDAGSVLGEGLTLFVLGALGGLLGLGLARGSGFARTPALIWQVMVLLSGLFAMQSGQPALGALIAVIGAVGLVLTWRVPFEDL